MIRDWFTKVTISLVLSVAWFDLFSLSCGIAPKVPLCPRFTAFLLNHTYRDLLVNKYFYDCLVFSLYIYTCIYMCIYIYYIYIYIYIIYIITGHGQP